MLVCFNDTYKYHNYITITLLLYFTITLLALNSPEWLGNSDMIEVRAH